MAFDIATGAPSSFNIVIGAGAPSVSSVASRPAVYPSRMPRRPAVRHRFQSYFGRIALAAVPVVPGRGPDAVATLVLNMAQGADTTYAWKTDILRGREGIETQRIALRGCPRENYSFSITMTDDEQSQLESFIAYQGALGAVFNIALTYESLLLAADTSTTVIPVGTTAKSDWCYPGARVIVIARDGSQHACVVQSASPTTITVDVAVPALIGKAGNLIMPVMPCYLEPTQDFGSYTVNAGEVSFKAVGILFGNEDSDWDPQGGTITTYTDPNTLIVWRVWTKRIDSDDGVTGRNMVLGTEIIDRGNVLTMKASWTFVDLARQVKCTVRNDTDRQDLKAFWGAVMGRQKTFLLPTWKPDLKIATGDGSTGTITVYGPPTVASDYVAAWSESQSHRWLQFFMSDGSVTYRTIDDCADNGNGTQDILLDSPVVGTIQMVSFLEKVRFNTDDFTIQWSGPFGYVDIDALVVQQ